MIRPVGVILAVGLLTVSGRAAGQQQSGVLDGCVERALNAARAKGAKVLKPAADAFLIAPDSFQHQFAFPADGCMGILAAGRRHAQALELSLYRSDGSVAAEQHEPAVYTYLHACGHAGERLFAHVRMRDGSGEVRLVQVWRAPEKLLELDEAMSDCRAVGMVRPEPIDVGPAPLGPPLRYSLMRLTERLAKLGYQRKGEPLRGSLAAMRRDVRRLALPGPRCYALAAIGDVDVGDIDLRVFGPEEAPRLLASDYARSREAIVKMCVEREGSFLLDVRVYDGGGNYLVQGYELPRPRTAVPAGVTSMALLGLTEVESLFASRGLVVQDTIWMLVPARGEQRIPLPLRAGGCYGIALVPSSDQEQGDLDLGVTDQHGNLVAGDMGPGNQPRVYVCPQADGLYVAVARTPDVTRPGRALLVMASDVPPEGP